MKVCISFLLAALCAGFANADKVRGVVTFSGDEFLVVAPEGKPNRKGTLVKRISDGKQALGLNRFQVGDLVTASGEWSSRGTTNAEFQAVQIVKGGRISQMPAINPSRNSNFRKGWKNLCRVRLRGEVVSAEAEENEFGGIETHMLLVSGGNRFAVRVHSDVEADKTRVGTWVAASGVALSVFGDGGNVLGTELEVSGSEDVVVLANPPFDIGFYVAVGVSSLFAVAAAVFLVAYLRSRRRRQLLEALAKERSRIASDLHDSLEQNLAGAKIRISAAAMMLDKDVAKAREFLKGAAEVLVKAKVEVRDAVMNLRGGTEGDSTLADELRAMASKVSESGAANVKTRLGALPEELPANVRFDLISIVKEAMTNAVKHGHASRIVLLAESMPDGCSVLRVLNNGDPFDPDSSLGPETGHFGLSGMRERAARSGLGLSFFHSGDWFGFEVAIRKETDDD